MDKTTGVRCCNLASFRCNSFISKCRMGLRSELWAGWLTSSSPMWGNIVTSCWNRKQERNAICWHKVRRTFNWNWSRKKQSADVSGLKFFSVVVNGRAQVFNFSFACLQPAVGSRLTLDFYSLEVLYRQLVLSRTPWRKMGPFLVE